MTERQASIADAVIGTLKAMKHSKLYCEESRQHVVTDKPTVVINTNSYNTNSNINSDHSSVTVASDNTEPFVQLKAVTDALNATQSGGAIKDAVKEMERTVGSKSFLTSFQKLGNSGRPHWRIWPISSALAQLLGG